MKTKLFITLVMSLVLTNNASGTGIHPTVDVLDVLGFECVHEKLTTNKQGITTIVDTEVYGYINDYFEPCPEYNENDQSNVAVPSMNSIIWQGKETDWGIPYDSPVYVESPHNPTCRFGLDPM